MLTYDEMEPQSYQVSLRRVTAYLIDLIVYIGILFAFWTAIGGSLQSFAVISRTSYVHSPITDGSLVVLSRSEVQRALACPRRGEFTRIEVMVVSQDDGSASSSVGAVAEGCGKPAELRVRLTNRGEEDRSDWPITTDEHLQTLIVKIIENSSGVEKTDTETGQDFLAAPERSNLTLARTHIDLVRADTGTTAKPPYAAPILSVNIAMYFLYFFIFEQFTNSGSLGKRILGIAVVTRDAVRLGFGASAIRTLIKCFIFPISVITVPFTRRRRALHDMAAGTYVVRAGDLRHDEGGRRGG